jgi:ribosomal protein L36
MKVRSKIVRMCQHCFTVRKKGKAYVYCKSDPRHKQRQKFGFLAISIESNYATTMLAMRYMPDHFAAMRAFLASETAITHDN